MSYIIGIDLGEISIGVAILNEQNREPISLDSMAVRIFPDGREDKTKSPLAVKRREARGIRRNLDRRLKRKEKLIKFLIDNNLISQYEDERLKLKTLNPYELRSKGLDEKLSLNELARVLIHINQRRGFLSNRKIDNNDESGDLKNAIKETTERIEKSDFRTLGEYLYSLQKQDTHSNLRVKVHDSQEMKVIEKINKKSGEITKKEKVVTVSNYNYFPSRELYKRELQEIFKKQVEFYPQLNDKIFDKDLNKEISIKDKIFDIIFYQRDLRPQDVGKCQFEPNEDRIAKVSPLFQEFRILSNLRNLDIYSDKKLTDEQRNKILGLLKTQKNVTFKKMRQVLKIDSIFNLEKTSKGLSIREDLEGSSTDIEMKKYINNWGNLDENKKEEYIEKIIGNSKDEEIIEYFINENVELTDTIEVLRTEIDSNGKKKKVKVTEPTDWYHLLDIRLEEGYGNLSRKALQKLLPLMRNGLKYHEACEKIYGSHSQKDKNKIYDELPYYGEILERSCIKQPNSTNNDEKDFGKLTNVTVHIALNQLRRAINEIIKEKGEKPSYIAIEIARDLKLNKKQKAVLEKQQKEDKKIVDEAIDKISQALKINKENVKKDDIYKYKIWRQLSNDPLKRMCPFCGKNISITDLFSPNFHIEHLLPFSRSYDDGIANKVIACSSCNNKKGNKTPYEAFGHTEEWDSIVARSLSLPQNIQWRFTKNAMKINFDKLDEEFWKEKYFGKQWNNFKDSQKEEIANTLFDKTQNHKLYLQKYNLSENQIDSIIEDFDSVSKNLLARMIKDTQYLSKAAAEYLDCLYPNDGIRHIRVSPGKLTAMLRYNWGLENLIQEAENINQDNEEKKEVKKDRTDHRHHAIDAFVVACTTPSILNKISKAAGKAKLNKNNKLLSEIEPPYQNFNIGEIKSIFDNIIISYKSDHKGLKQAKDKNKTISQLHNETNYGLIEDIDGKTGIFATRKPFIDLDKDLIMKNPENDNKYIADEKIRNDLQELVKDVSDKQEIKRIIENYSKTAMIRKDKTPIVIKTIRIHEIKPYKSLMSVKDSKTEKPYKYAETNGNYCAEIYIPNRGKNEGKWCIEIISNFDAHKKDFIPKWRKEEPEAKMIMRVFINDMLELEINDNNKDSAIKKLIPFIKNNKIIVKVKKMTNGMIHLRPHNVAKENKEGELTWAVSGESLRLANAKKVRISPLGKITYLKK